MKVLNFLVTLSGLVAVGFAIPSVSFPCKPKDTYFCSITPTVDMIMYCPNEGNLQIIKECSPTEYCVGFPHPPDVTPHCEPQTTTTYSMSPPTAPPTATSTPGPVPTSFPDFCTTANVFCTQSNLGGVMAYCEPGSPNGPEVVHQCAQNEYCVAVADESKHIAELRCSRDPRSGPKPSESIQPTVSGLVRRSEGAASDAAKVYCDDNKIVYNKPGAEPKVLHTCDKDNYCVGNDNFEVDRLRLYCQYEDPSVSMPEHSHLHPTATTTATANLTATHSPTRSGRTIHTNIARAEPSDGDDNTAVETMPTDPLGTYCGFCIDLQGDRSELRAYGLNCINIPGDDTRYLACSNQYCGICMIFEGRDCQGDIIHSGGPREGSYSAKPGRSHWCL